MRVDEAASLHVSAEYVGVGDVAYASPTRVDIVDNSEVDTGELPEVRAIGITVTTLPTSVPV